jgi:hypothetical protein
MNSTASVMRGIISAGFSLMLVSPGSALLRRLTIELLLNVAARRGDAQKLGWQHIKEGKIC